MEDTVMPCSATSHSVTYVAITTAVSFFCLFWFQSARKSKGDSLSGYFLASKNMHWLPVCWLYLSLLPYSTYILA